MISIIITARNQATDLKRCLNAIMDGAASDELEIIVACNGCSDETAQVARQFGPPVRVIEMPPCSLADGFNLADRVASAFPRFYIQAQAVCRLSSIRRMVEQLSAGPALAIAPPIFMKLDESGPVVRSYYEIAQRMPSHLEGLRGSGVFGMSKAAKQRLADFPQIIAIEEFVRFSLKPGEFVRLESTRSWVTPPAACTGLLAAETQRIRGVKQLRGLEPSMNLDSGKRNRRVLRRLFFRRPDLWLEIAIFVFVQVFARVAGIAGPKRVVRPRVKIVQPTATVTAADLAGELSDPQTS